MALLLGLGLKAALARGCLHCHGNFSKFYSHHVKPQVLLLVQWKTAMQGLLLYILISPSFTGLEPPHLANLTLENA
uniref:IZUMO family member 4 n=1 Tax=Molossus molossus TaxID=27622 RepID=A0A7J8I8I3_MOLMO|nr:IZUMO family member 4 [Molossus molossus]